MDATPDSSPPAAAAAPVLRVDEILPTLTKEVLKEGEGATPASGDEVKAHYIGRLTDGTIFDQSHGRGPFSFTLGAGQVIKAWDAGFATMRKGERAFLRCGADVAYGARGSPPTIPPNATLIFEVELLGFGPKPKDFADMTTREQMGAAEAAKASGNAAFTSGDLFAAIEAYNEGWRAVGMSTDTPYNDEPLTPEESASLKALKVVLRSNAAMAHLKGSAWAEAVACANDALRVDPHHAKSLFRRGTGHAHLGLLDEARADLLAAAKLTPGDAAIAAELARVKGLASAAAAKEKAMWGGKMAKF